MDLQTILFYGKSGAGKGTQAVLLKKYLEEQDKERPTLYFETGHALRQLAEGDSPAAVQTKQVLGSGGLMPSLLVVWMWGDYFIQNLHGHEHIILDGVARREQEAPLVHDALIFFNRHPRTVINIDVSRDWAFEHLKGRGRADDTDEKINSRLDWYETNVVPAMQFFKDQSDAYTFLDINGERPIAEVHQDLIEQLGLKSDSD